MRRELAALQAVREAAVPASAELSALTEALATVNAALWDIEDALREAERRRAFGPRFVALARSVYMTNDRRAALKKAINAHLGSALTEEKSYAAY